MKSIAGIFSVVASTVLVFADMYVCAVNPTFVANGVGFSFGVVAVCGYIGGYFLLTD